MCVTYTGDFVGSVFECHAPSKLRAAHVVTILRNTPTPSGSSDAAAEDAINSHGNHHGTACYAIQPYKAVSATELVIYFLIDLTRAIHLPFRKIFVNKHSISGTGCHIGTLRKPIVTFISL